MFFYVAGDTCSLISASDNDMILHKRLPAKAGKCGSADELIRFWEHARNRTVHTAKQMAESLSSQYALPVVRPQVMLTTRETDVDNLLDLMKMGMTTALIDCSAGTRDHQRHQISDVREAEILFRQHVGHQHTHIAIVMQVRHENEDDIEFAVLESADAVLTEWLSVEETQELRQKLGLCTPVIMTINDKDAVKEEELAQADGVLIQNHAGVGVHGIVTQCLSQAKMVFRKTSTDSFLQPADCLVISHTDSATCLSALTEIWEQHKEAEGELMEHEDDQDDKHMVLAYNMSLEPEVKAIIAISKDGNTVRKLVRHRPVVPVVAVVNNERLVRQMRLLHGVLPLLFSGEIHTPDWTMVDDYGKFDDRVAAAVDLLQHLGILTSGSGHRVAVVTGTRDAAKPVQGAVHFLDPSNGAAIVCTLPV